MKAVILSLTCVAMLLTAFPLSARADDDPIQRQVDEYAQQQADQMRQFSENLQKQYDEQKQSDDRYQSFLDSLEQARKAGAPPADSTPSDSASAPASVNNASVVVNVPQPKLLYAPAPPVADARPVDPWLANQMRQNQQWQLAQNRLARRTGPVAFR